MWSIIQKPTNKLKVVIKMSHDSDRAFNYNGVIDEIDKAIHALGNGLEEMVYIRHLITAQNYGVDMKELTDIMLCKGKISQDEIIIIDRVTERKEAQMMFGL